MKLDASHNPNLHRAASKLGIAALCSAFAVLVAVLTDASLGVNLVVATWLAAAFGFAVAGALGFRRPKTHIELDDGTLRYEVHGQSRQRQGPFDLHRGRRRQKISNVYFPQIFLCIATPSERLLLLCPHAGSTEAPPDFVEGPLPEHDQVLLVDDAEALLTFAGQIATARAARS